MSVPEEGVVRQRNSPVLIVCFVILLGILILMLMPICWPYGHSRGARACLSNLKNLGAAMALYSDENDGLLPPRDEWMDALTTLTKPRERQRERQPLDEEDPILELRFKCPALPEPFEKEGYGYAMNSLLDGSQFKSIPNERATPMLYESINYARNASDPFLSLPPEGRHGEKVIIVHADTFARAVPLDEIPTRYAEFFKGFAPKAPAK